MKSLKDTIQEKPTGVGITDYSEGERMLPRDVELTGRKMLQYRNAEEFLQPPIHS